MKTGQMTDQRQMSLLQEERRTWCDVLIRLIAIIQSLAGRNLAFRGSSDRLSEPNNENFLKEVELLDKFDPIMQQHLSKIKDGAHYLGKNIQNELIQWISGKLMDKIARGRGAAHTLSRRRKWP